jgi:hypothetical protein
VAAPSPASPTPRLAGSQKGILQGVVAVSSGDVWAVGETGGGVYRSGHALVEHWDGTSWSTVDAGAPGVASWLLAVAADGPDDVWASGLYVDSRANYHGYVDHWDGTSWSLSPIDAGAAMLDAISVVGPDDVWTASLDATGGRDGQVFHWDGSAWAEVSTPSVGWFIGFTGLDALSATNAWLVGYKKSGHHTIVEHWDGTSWRIVSSRDSTKLESLYGVTASSPGDLWAVGLAGSEAFPTALRRAESGLPPIPMSQLIMHSTGHGWRPVPAPALRARSALLGISSAGSTAAWAVGFVGFPATKAVIDDWNGTSWVRANGVGVPRRKRSVLNAVSSSSPTDAWAVGAAGTDALIEYWNGSTWTPVQL